MVDKEVIITYKRKRFSSQPDLVHGTKTSKPVSNSPNGRSCPKVESASNEKLNKDHSTLQCFKCGNFDADENLLRCESCSQTYNFHCMDTPQKFAQKWQCPTCHRTNVLKKSLQYHVSESRRGRKSRRVEESEMGHMELCSPKLLTIEDVGGHSMNESSSLENSTDSIQIDCTHDKSSPSSKFTDLDVSKTNPVCLNPSSEVKYTPKCPEDSLVTQNADKADERSMEIRRTPLIMFSRRVKQKLDGTGKSAENSKLVENQCSSTTRRDSSQICSLEHQSANPAQAETVNAEKDAGLNSMADGGFGETNITCDGPKDLMPSGPEADVPSEDQPSKPMVANATDSIKTSSAAKNSSSVGEKYKNKLVVMNSEKTNLPCESSKPSIDVAENLEETHTSSSPGFPIVQADADTDGRDRELEWLEDLDRVLQDKNMNRDTCSFIDHGGMHTSSGKASPMVPAKSPTPNTCDQQCFQYSNFDVEASLLRCECCDKTYHFHCMDNSQKSTQRKWKCPTCHKKNGVGESLQYYVREFKRGRKIIRVEGTETGLMESIKLVGDVLAEPNSFAADSSRKKAADSIQIGCTYDKSGPSSNFTDLDILKPNPTCFSTSGCPEDSLMTLNSGKVVACSKGNHRTPLITFRRRVKSKQDGTGKFADLNLEPEEKCSSRTLGSHAEARCIYEGSSQICRFKDQSASAELLEQAEMTNIKNDAGHKFTASGAFPEPKIACDGPEERTSRTLLETNISHQNAVPSRSGDQLNKLMATDATDFIKNSILIQGKKHSNSKTNSPVRDRSENNLEILSSKKINLPCDYLSACMSNIGSSKMSTDVVPENLVESQSSSNPSIPVLLVNKETDGKSKELEWLEDLDKVLKEKKKKRETCSFIDQGSSNCGQVSNVEAAPTVPVKLSVQSSCNQGASPEYMNHMTELLGKPVYTNFGNQVYTNFGNQIYDKQHHEESLRRSSLCTNFLGLAMPPNHGINNAGSIIDVQRILSTSCSRAKVNVHSTNMHNLWSNRYSTKWSEEELDFLWIGIRRHGINNWNAMLRDPKLRFSESRTAVDLAMQWDIEQRKLFKGTLMHSSRFPRQPDYCSEFPMLTAENRFSLGIANPLRSENSSTSSFFGGISLNQMFPKPGSTHQIPIRSQNTRCERALSISQRTGEKLINEHQSATSSSNLPDWLKEALNNTSHTLGLNTANDSWARGILKRKSPGSGHNIVGVRINEMPTSDKSALDFMAQENKKKNSLGLVGPSDLVVIESDASSEETISDS